MRRPFLPAAFVAALLAATTPLAGEADTASGWALLAIGGVAVEPGASIAFSADGAVFGTTGCNRFSGQVVAAPGTLRFTGPLAATKMACPGPRMSQEALILEALSGAVAVAYDPVTDQMVLIPASGAASLRFARQH